MNQAKQVTEEVQVAVRGIAVGGAGVGRVTGPEGRPEIGMTAFVPLTAPGETVRARIVKRQERYLEADLLTVEEPSADRITPPCRYFGTCGGCDIQHLNYPAQLSAKEEMIQGAFRTGGLPDVAEKLAPIVAGPPLQYRQRITLHVDGAGRLGYFRRHSHALLMITECPIAVPAIDAFLAEGFTLAGTLPQLERRRGSGRTDFWGDLEVEATQDGRLDAVFWVRGKLPKGRQTARMIADRLAQRFAGGRVLVEGEVAARFGADDPAFQLRATPGAPGEFSQVNAAINAPIVAAIRTFAEGLGAKTANDLYAGAGNFSLPLAELGIKTVAVEASQLLVGAGKEEATRRGLGERLAFLAQPVEEYLRDRPASPADLVVADPPRAGLGREVVSRLGYAQNLVLLSCHLPSAVRDLRDLAAEGWVVESITPFDMFPQTAHIELLTVLRRAG